MCRIILTMDYNKMAIANLADKIASQMLHYLLSGYTTWLNQ